MSVLVVGGTGTVGREVLQRLADRAESVAVLSRRPEIVGALPKGVQGVAADLEKPDTLPPALRGITRVVLITPVHPHETQMGVNLVRAAKVAGVSRVVYMSVHRVEDCPEAPHFRSKIEIQKALQGSGLEHTFIMPNSFFQNDLMLREPLLEHGLYPVPFGEKGLSRVDVRDIAEAIVKAVTEDGHSGRRYPLVGPEALTATRLAEIWSQRLGRPVRYAGDDLEAWAEQVAPMLPGWMVDDLRIMYRFFQERGLRASREEVAQTEELLGHPPRRFEEFAAETVQAWAAAGVAAG